MNKNKSANTTSPSGTNQPVDARLSLFENKNKNTRNNNNNKV